MTPAQSAVEPTEPGVGVYGRGRHHRGIGVAGACDQLGVGVYGMAVDYGAGVVGRSMSGEQGETVPPVELVGRSAGVVGQAKNGVGVFGHGGSFAPSVDGPVWFVGYNSAT